MAEAFDPYHKWLGIPSKDQPPNHYRLLAINLFESDLDVIASAADQRMGHVRTFQAGKHSAQSQKILNEISAARICLLSPEKKARYDRELRRSAADSPKAVVPPAAAHAKPAADTPSISTGQPTSAGYASRREKQSWLVVGAVGIVIVLCVGIMAVLLLWPDSSAPVADRRPSVPNDKPAVPDDEPPLPDDEPPIPDDDPPISDDEPPIPDDEPQVPDDEPQVPGENPPTPDAKLPAPDADAQAKAEEQLRELLAGATHQRLLGAALAGQHGAAERFVLLVHAADAAAASGDPKNALRAVSELAKRYEIDTIQVEAETLIKLNGGAKTSDTYRAVAQRGLALVDQAVSVGRHEIARRVATTAIGAARKAEDNELAKRATVRFLQLRAQP